MIITENDRDECGRIMLEAERRAAIPAAAEAPPASVPAAAEAPPPAPRPVRAIRPEERVAPAAPVDTPTLRARLTHGALAIGVVAGLALVILGSHPQPATAPARSAPTAAAPTVAPPSPSPQATRMIVAYWAPDGQALPEPIAEGDAYHFVGRLGDAWAQAELPGGGVVWVRRTDLHLDPDDLAALAAAPDRTPPTPAPIVVLPPQPAIVQEAPPVPTELLAPTALVVPPMRFPVDAPDALPAPRRVSKPPPGTRPYGLVSPLQPPAAVDQPRFGEQPTQAPAPAGGQP